MELHINRYYKDDKKGYRFLSNKGFFSDEVLRSNIEENILAEVIGNKSVSAWVGGVSFDLRRNPFYIFGHNMMCAQERGSSRLSSRYTFVAIPFDSLCGIGPIAGLMREISMLEERNSFSSETIVYPTSIRSSHNLEPKISDALSMYLVDKEIRVNMQATPERCRSAIELVWNRSVLPEYTPLLSYLDRGSQEQPQRGWIFQDAQFFDCKISESLRLSSRNPENDYLYRVGKLILGRENRNFRKLYSSSYQQEFALDVGKQNEKMLPHAMAWHFALYAGIVEALPTSIEKRYLLQNMK